MKILCACILKHECYVPRQYFPTNNFCSVSNYITNQIFTLEEMYKRLTLSQKREILALVNETKQRFQQASAHY